MITAVRERAMLKTLMIKGTLIAFVCSVSFTAHAMADSPSPSTFRRVSSSPL